MIFELPIDHYPQQNQKIVMKSFEKSRLSLLGLRAADCHSTPNMDAALKKTGPKISFCVSSSPPKSDESSPRTPVPPLRRVNSQPNLLEKRKEEQHCHRLNNGRLGSLNMPSSSLCVAAAEARRSSLSVNFCRSVPLMVSHRFRLFNNESSVSLQNLSDTNSASMSNLHWSVQALSVSSSESLAPK